MTAYSSPDPLLDALVFLCRHYERPRSKEVILAGLPAVPGPLSPKMFTAAAEQAGLVARTRRMSLESSLSALMPNRGQANYAAAKAGIIAASRSLASEVARFGVRVNVVAPGLIETDMIKDAPVDQIKQIIPMARLGKPQEVASVIRFLCSDDASYVTGQVIGINGGIC